MCQWGTGKEIVIERRLTVDACIADAVVTLNRFGVYTTGCCCGHGKGPPTATILPSAQERARELGYVVTLSEGSDPVIEIRSNDEAQRIRDLEAEIAVMRQQRDAFADRCQVITAAPAGVPGAE
jgi:hypothetical protein